MSDEYTNENNQQIYPDMKERGIYKGPSEEDFESESSIRRRKAIAGDFPEFVTPIPEKKDYDYWSARAIRRHEEYQETDLDAENHFVIRFPDDILFNISGDWHEFNPSTVSKRLDQEIRTIKNTPNSYIAYGGDGIHGLFFNPGQMEQTEQPPEQFAWLNSTFEFLKGKLLIAHAGDHESWAKKQGIDPFHEFPQKYGGYYVQNVGHLTLEVGDQVYRLTGGHRLPGSSIYNNAHPSARASREIQGADIYYNLHTHRKGHLEQSIKLHGGEARWTHMISCGPYSKSSDYARKKGFPKLDLEEMSGYSIWLSAKEKRIRVYKDIVEAHRDFTS